MRGRGCACIHDKMVGWKEGGRRGIVCVVGSLSLSLFDVAFYADGRSAQGLLCFFFFFFIDERCVSERGFRKFFRT